MARSNLTLQESFDYFRRQSSLTPGSQSAYGYALQHFFVFLEHSKSAKDLSLAGPEPSSKTLDVLGQSPFDINLLLWFVTYLANEAQSPRQSRNKTLGQPGFEPATVRLYGQALITFFRFLADELLLPEAFPSTAAITRAQRRLRDVIPATQARDNAPEPPEGIEDLIHAFDELDIPEDLSLRDKHLLKLETLRNRALLYGLADSGARISELLRITADDVRRASLNEESIWKIEVKGKGRGKHGRTVTLRFTEATLMSMRDYLQARADPGATSLFVSHARTRPDKRGVALSARAVWGLVGRAALKLGLPHIHPHDFRHWRATQMLQAGVPIDQVQRFHNHRSIKTTQNYARTAERQVDAAGQRTSPFADNTSIDSDEERS
jgi:integrase